MLLETRALKVHESPAHAQGIGDNKFLTIVDK